MDILNFEYHNIPLDMAETLAHLVEEYYKQELELQDTLVFNPLKVNYRLAESLRAAS